MRNALLESKTLPRGVYRRAPPVSPQTTKRRLRVRYAMSAKRNSQLLEFDPSADPPPPTRANAAADGPPHPLIDVEIFGVAFHEHCALG